MYRKMLAFVLLLVMIHPALAAADPFTLRKFMVVATDANTVLSPDGQTLAVYEDAGFNNNEVTDPSLLPIRLVNVDDGKEIMTLTEGITDYTTSVSFSSDSKTLAAEQENGALTIWDVASGKLLNTFPNTIGGHLLTFVPNGTLLLDASGMATLLWDTSSGVINRLYTTHYDTYAEFSASLGNGPASFLIGLAALPDGKSFVTLSENGSLSLRNVDNADETILLPAFTEMGDTYRRVSPVVTPDGKYLLYGDFKDKQIHVLDISTQQDVRQINTDAISVGHFVAVAPDNDTVAVLQPAAADQSSDTGVVHLYSLKTGESLFDIPIPTKPLGRYQVAFTPDGKQLVISGFPDTSREGHNVVYVATLTS